MQLLQWALPQAGHRWRGYRRVRRTVCKRIDRRLTELGLDGYDAYRAYLEGHATEWRRFDAFCRIPISRFYRDRAVFEAMRSQILPDLATAALKRDERTLQVWCAGCASGEEVYSLAMLWTFEQRHGYPTLRLDILGTDAEPVMIERARAGCYKASSLREIPAQWRQEGFDFREQLLCVRPRFRHMPHWAIQDMRKEMPNGPYDLILCRNVAFTYFDDTTQRKVLDGLTNRLLTSGVLVIGGHEELPGRPPVYSRPFASLPIYRLTDPISQ